MSKHLVINTQVDRNNPRLSDWQPSPTVSSALHQQNSSSSPLKQQQRNRTNTLIEEVEEEEEEEEEDDDDDEEEEEDDEDELDEDDDSTYTSSPSIPDENINFDMVYALHTFVATVEGQASVYKGDALTLLDDSNSYWWLVNVIKTAEVGYIPAENIEASDESTPFERLARLNKHRNAETTSLDQATHYIPKKIEKTGNKVKRRVTIGKDLSVQAHIILIGDDGEEEVGEAYEEWKENIVDNSTESEDDDDDDDDDADGDDGEEVDSDDDSMEGCVPLSEIIHSNGAGPSNQLSDQANTSIVAPLKQQPQQQPQQQQQPVIVNSSSTSPSVTRPEDKRSAPFWSLFSRNKKDNLKLTPPREDTDRGSIASVNSSSNEDNNHARSPSNNPGNLRVLRVSAGNINVGAMYHTLLVDEHTSAERLLIQAMERFHIAQIEDKTAGRSSRTITPTHTSGVEYYLTVKSLNGDEITLAPQDKPLAIFQTLTNHLTTPMPSIAHVKQFSQKQSQLTDTTPRLHPRPGKDPEIGFYLHKRIRRINERDGKIYVKVALLSDPVRSKELSRSSSFSKNLRKKKQDISPERIDKLIAVPASISIADLTVTALEKFHISHSENVHYRMAVSTQPSKLLNTSARLAEIMHDDAPREVGEKTFILRKMGAHQPRSSSSRSSITKVSPERISRQQQRTPLTVSCANTKIEGVLYRVDSALQSLSKDKKRSLATGIAVSRNMDGGIDITLSNGLVRSKPLLQNQVQYTLIAKTGEVVASKVVSQPSSKPVSVNLQSVTEQDLDALTRYGSACLDAQEQRPGRRSANGSLSLDILDSSVGQMSTLDDLEKEFQRIIASHAF
ncbi:hypothetical protein BX666DRAFT_2023435 [Dichotomocladium elegans]|nr:hypothetical protein BX666DRAFT_2023435 [Dichotomocladium elegans]